MNNFIGKYQNIRSTLDYNYHENYSEVRQLEQDNIITSYIEKFGPKTQTLNNVNPVLLFSAGSMGSGKTYSLNRLQSELGIALQEYLFIDPDKIKEMLPNYPINMDKLNNASLHKDSAFIAEIIFGLGLQYNYNIISDGSMHDHIWYTSLLDKLKKSHSHYYFRIMYVKAPIEIIKNRVLKRTLVTKRYVPMDKILYVHNKVPNSIEILKDYVDRVDYVENEIEPKIIKTILNNK